MLKKILLTTSVMAALSACSSNSDGNGHYSAGFKKYTDVYNANAVKTSGITINVADIQKIKQAELVDEFGSAAQDANYSITVGNKAYKSNDVIDISNHMPQNQVADVRVSHHANKTVDGINYHITENQKVRGYRQDYSVVAGYQRTGVQGNIPELENSTTDMEITMVKGQTTTESALPKTGTYNYSGAAFTQNDRNGKLSYDVNFDKRVGSGTITGIEEAGKITLKEGSIQSMSYTNSELDGSRLTGMGIQSTAVSEKNQTGTYTLGFFGPEAEEIAGSITSNDGEVGFGGKRSNTAK